MKTIDLGESMETTEPKPAKSGKPQVYYPSVHFSDKGHNDKPSLDEADLGKVIRVTAHIKLVGIHSHESDAENTKGKKFEYSFEVHKLELPDDMESNKEALSRMQSDRAKKRGEVQWEKYERI
jgi:hypothetical protein